VKNRWVQLIANTILIISGMVLIVVLLLYQCTSSIVIIKGDNNKIDKKVKGDAKLDIKLDSILKDTIK